MVVAMVVVRDVLTSVLLAETAKERKVDKPALPPAKAGLREGKGSDGRRGLVCSFVCV